jgi:hypothetical protein
MVNGVYGSTGVGGVGQDQYLQYELEEGVVNAFSQCQSPSDVMNMYQQLMSYLPELQQMGIPTDGLGQFVQEVGGMAMQQVQQQGIDPSQYGYDPSQGGYDPSQGGYDPSQYNSGDSGDVTQNSPQQNYISMDEAFG